MDRFRLCTLACTALLLLLPQGRAGEEVQIRDPQVHPGYPDFLRLLYMVGPDTLSPDGRLGVLYPSRAGLDQGMMEDLLVALHPFRLLGIIEAQEPYFEGESHGGLTVQWSADSTVALVELAGKWGPRHEVLIELSAGHMVRQTDLAAKARALLLPDFRRSKAVPYNDETPFILDEEEGTGFKLVKGGQVRIDTMGATNPKGDPGPRSWRARVKAVWDIGQGKFLSEKVSR